LRVCQQDVGPREFPKIFRKEGSGGQAVASAYPPAYNAGIKSDVARHLRIFAFSNQPLAGWFFVLGRFVISTSNIHEFYKIFRIA